MRMLWCQVSGAECPSFVRDAPTAAKAMVGKMEGRQDKRVGESK